MTEDIKRRLLLVAIFAAVFWGVEVLDLILPWNLDEWGIRPRSLVGLRGIVFAPFLHGGFLHLISNTVPFLILGGVIALHGRSELIDTTVTVMIIGGIGTWLFGGANTVHIGASGLVFGYFGYLIGRGFFEKSVVSILIALAVGFLYGGLIWGVFPTRPGVSWQGHLFGFIGGVVAARLSAGARKGAAQE